VARLSAVNNPWGGKQDGGVALMFCCFPVTGTFLHVGALLPKPPRPTSPVSRQGEGTKSTTSLLRYARRKHAGMDEF
jgi:hypothetical protein